MADVPASCTTLVAGFEGFFPKPYLDARKTNKRWTILALLRDIEGISHKVLTQQLRALEADRLVERTDFAAGRDQTGSRPDA